jgi:hypothetical protein
MKKMKFREMKAGQRFSDGRRTFIKIQQILPSGYTQRFVRILDLDPYQNKLDANDGVPFNSIDEDGGVPANCPDHVEFILIDK